MVFNLKQFVSEGLNDWSSKFNEENGAFVIIKKIKKTKCKAILCYLDRWNTYLQTKWYQHWLRYSNNLVEIYRKLRKISIFNTQIHIQKFITEIMKVIN